MIAKNPYQVFPKKWCIRNAIFRYDLFCFFLFLILIPCFGLAEEKEEATYDEFKIFLNVQGVGGARVSAYIKDQSAWLSVSEVFTLLKIKNAPSERLDSLSGFFIDPQNDYLIDQVRNQITFQDKKIELKPDDLFLTESNLYMKTSCFGEIFGLNCVFSFRELTVTMTTRLELPFIRDMKLEQMRANLRRLKGEIKTDTTIGRSYPLFNFGLADWSVATSQGQGINSNTQLNFAGGSVVAGGEMNVNLHYDQINGFKPRQQSYLWRYVNNDYSPLRQVMIGKIIPHAISTLNGSIIGIQLTNTPSVYRRSYGTYTLSNMTEPGWLVELYVNNVLVDFVKADASGFYKFEVPLVYGNSVMMVRMYGPWGEVRTRTETSNIPFNFSPQGELEYTVNAGVVETMPNSKFTHTSINYGVSRSISIQGGYEYYSSPLVENSLPFIGSSVMLANNLLLAGEYTLGTRLKSSLSYRLPSSLQFDVNFTGYQKGQMALPFAPLQEQSISVSTPIRGRHFSSYSRLSLSQTIYSDFNSTNAVFLFSGNINRVSSNFTTTASYLDPKHIFAYSDFSLLFRLKGQITIMPSTQYDYSQKRLVFARCNFEKPLFGNGYLNFALEHNFAGKMSSFEIGLRYDFSFMQTGLSSRFSKNASTFYQSASGSLLIDSKNKYIGTSNTSKVGRGNFIVLAFLDLNCNGKRDKNEPKIPDLNIQVNGGRVVKSDKDSTIRVFDLTPYTSYLVEVDKNSIQSISWQIKKSTLSVYADPNQFKTVEIPLEVMGEASGTVDMKTLNMTRGQGGVYVNFYREDQTFVGRTLTEEDGYFNYIGLHPGKYIARLDSSQLVKTKLKVTPESNCFMVQTSIDGDVVEGLNYTLQSFVDYRAENALEKLVTKSVSITNRTESIIINPLKTEKHTEVTPGSDNQEVRQDSLRKVKINEGLSSPVVVKKIDLSYTAQKTNLKPTPLPDKSTPTITPALNRNSKIAVAKKQQYPVHYGAYIADANILSVQQKITAVTGRPAIFVLEDGFYRLWIVGFSSRTEAESYSKKLNEMGYQSSVIKGNPHSLISATKEQQYSLQVGKYIFDENALTSQKKIMTTTGLPAIFVLEKGLYKLWAVGFSKKSEAEELVKRLTRKGYQNYVVKDIP